MTETGGFDILFGWLIFVGWLAVLGYFVLRYKVDLMTEARRSTDEATPGEPPGDQSLSPRSRP
jgi:hypothetical protein